MRRGKQAPSHRNNSTDFTRKVWSPRGLAAKDPRIQRALDLLPRSQAVQIGNVAETLNLSASRFRHLFKKELGISPTQYLRLIRLARAKELIENSFLSVKEVTALIGVKDVSHFVRSYKVLYGQTPSVTRALFQQALYRRCPG